MACNGFALMDDYRLTGRVVHLGQFADAPGKGVRLCEFVQQRLRPCACQVIVLSHQVT
jgi:hypothetical protein